MKTTFYSTLLVQATTYVKNQKGRLPTLAIETGIDYQWLRKFSDGCIADPGVSRIERLLKHAEQHGIVIEFCECKAA